MTGPTSDPGRADLMAMLYIRLVKELHLRMKSPVMWGAFVERIVWPTLSEDLTCRIDLLLQKADGHMRLAAFLKEQ